MMVCHLEIFYSKFGSQDQSTEFFFFVFWNLSAQICTSVYVALNRGLWDWVSQSFLIILADLQGCKIFGNTSYRLYFLETDVESVLVVHLLLWVIYNIKDLSFGCHFYAEWVSCSLGAHMCHSFGVKIALFEYIYTTAISTTCEHKFSNASERRVCQQTIHSFKKFNTIYYAKSWLISICAHFEWSIK